jgi:hypothetical protein
MPDQCRKSFIQYEQSEDPFEHLNWRGHNLIQAYVHKNLWPKTEIFDYLLSFLDFDLNNVSKSGGTALSVCATHEPHLCKMLLEKGADPN